MQVGVHQRVDFLAAGAFSARVGGELGVGVVDGVVLAVLAVEVLDVCQSQSKSAVAHVPHKQLGMAHLAVVDDTRQLVYKRPLSYYIFKLHRSKITTKITKKLDNKLSSFSMLNYFFY